MISAATITTYLVLFVHAFLMNLLFGNSFGVFRVCVKTICTPCDVSEW